MDRTERALYVALGLFLVMLAFVFVGAIIAAMTASECMSYGYRTGKFTVNLVRYCETRSEQTDVVVPLADVRAKLAKERIR